MNNELTTNDKRNLYELIGAFKAFKERFEELTDLVREGFDKSSVDREKIHESFEKAIRELKEAVGADLNLLGPAIKRAAELSDAVHRLQDRTKAAEDSLAKLQDFMLAEQEKQRRWKWLFWALGAGASIVGGVAGFLLTMLLVAKEVIQVSWDKLMHLALIK